MPGHRKRRQNFDDQYFENDDYHYYGYSSDLNDFIDAVTAGSGGGGSGNGSAMSIDFPQPRVIKQRNKVALPKSETRTEEEESFSSNKKSMAGGRYAGKLKAHARNKQHRRASKLVYEESGHVYDYNCVYIGHATMDPRRTMYVVCFGITRALLAHAGFDTNNSTAHAYDINAVFQFTYRETPVQSSLTSVDYLAMVNGTPKSLETMANELWSSLESVFNAHPNAAIGSVTLLPRTDGTLGGTNLSGSAKSISFSTSMVHLQVISTLKVQNTTKHLNIAGNTEQEEATAVDAAPLVGMIYSGKGQGTWSKAKDDSTPYLICAGGSTSGSSNAGVQGCICAIAGTNKSFQEPPNPDQLTNVRKWSGVKFQPGDLKVSRLVSRISMPVSTMLNKLGRLVIPLSWSDQSLGQFSVMALEKMIGLKGADDEDNPAVEIDFEDNQEFSVYVKVKNDYCTPQLFTKAESRTIGPL